MFLTVPPKPANSETLDSVALGAKLPVMLKKLLALAERLVEPEPPVRMPTAIPAALPQSPLVGEITPLAFAWMHREPAPASVVDWKLALSSITVCGVAVPLPTL